MAEIDLERAIQRFAAAGLVVGEEQALEALSVSREAEAAQLFRSLTISGIEPMISFDPRWRR